MLAPFPGAQVLTCSHKNFVCTTATHQALPVYYRPLGAGLQLELKLGLRATLLLQ